MFFRNFPKIFRTAILKENLLMGVPYFIKENLRMSSSYVAKLKNKFGGSRLSSTLILKAKWYHNSDCCHDSLSCKQLQKRVTDTYFERKVGLSNLITFCYSKFMLPLQYLSDWCLHGVYVWQKFQRKNIS